MRRINKLNRIIETAQIDWSHVSPTDYLTNIQLYVMLRKRLTSAQIDELYNARPICITVSYFPDSDEYFDYLYHCIKLSKKGVVSIYVLYDGAITG